MSETMTETMTAPICKTVICKRPLTYLEKSKCWRCLVCNPLTKTAPTIEPKKKYVDVKMTEERVREICQDVLENWHIQKPPVTTEELEKLTGTNNAEVPIKTEPETWRQKAKRMGVKTHNDYTGGARKKVDVLAEMEAKEASQETKQPTEQTYEPL